MVDPKLVASREPYIHHVPFRNLGFSRHRLILLSFVTSISFPVPAASRTPPTPPFSTSDTQIRSSMFAQNVYHNRVRSPRSSFLNHQRRDSFRRQPRRPPLPFLNAEKLLRNEPCPHSPPFLFTLPRCRYSFRQLDRRPHHVPHLPTTCPFVSD